MDEEWRAVVGWEGLYEVSDLGRVRMLARSYIDASGHPRSFAARVLNQNRGPHGYQMVWLKFQDRQKNCTVHRLVASAFIRAPEEERWQVNHRDGDKSNCRATNLEWSSPSENMRHAIASGLSRVPALSGERHPRSRFTDAQRLDVRSRHARGETWSQIARAYGVGISTVAEIERRARMKENA